MFGRGRDGPLRWRPRAFTLVAAFLAALLLAFLLVEWVGPAILVDPSPRLERMSPVAAAAGVGLLVIDAVLPVPSSVVMVVLGATFGAAAGFALSVAGSVGGFGLGYVLGRLSAQGVVSISEPRSHDRLVRFVRRWGVLAVAVSRPLPLVAETVAFTSGAFGLRPVPALLASLAGSAGPAAVYAYAGSQGATTVDGLLVFALVAVVAMACWLLGRRLAVSRTATGGGE